MLRFASMDCRKSFTRITGRPLPAGLGRPEPLIDAMGSARHVADGAGLLPRRIMAVMSGWHRTLTGHAESSGAGIRSGSRGVSGLQKRYNEDRPRTMSAGGINHGELLRQIAAGVSAARADSGVRTPGVFGAGACMKKGQVYWKDRKSLSQ